MLWVPTGTAANCLALAALCPPYGGVVCHRDSHIQNDEGGAPEFYTHGAKLMLADGAAAKLDPAGIETVIDQIANDVHRVQPHAISITNATEYGAVYTPDEVAAIGALAKDRGLGFHMDGARFAQRGRRDRRVGRRPDMARGGRCIVVRVREERRDGCRGAGVLPSRTGRRYLAAPQACRAAGIEGALSRRANPCDAGGRPVAGVRAVGERRRAGAGRRGGRADWSIRSKRTRCSCASPPPRPRGCARKAMISTIGRRARRGW